MHSILVIIDPSTVAATLALTNQRQLFYTNLQNFLETRKDIEQITDHVLLIPTQSELFAFVEICKLCSGAGFPYKCIFFEEAPVLVPSKV